MTFDPATFFDSVGTYLDSSNDVETAGPPVRLATVNPAYGGSGAARVTFDGEATMTTKSYRLVGAAPAAGSRVLMVKVGSSYLILGALT